jgi:hypothetical protein
MGYQAYRAGALLQRPAETVDRIRSRLERRLDAVLPVSFASCQGTHGRLHDLLDAPPTCDVCSGFDDVWTSVTARLPGSCGHDAAPEWLARHGPWCDTCVRNGSSRPA